MRSPLPKKEMDALAGIVATQRQWELGRNLLAEFYSKLATMAFERHQWELADDYIRLANRVLA